MTGARPRLLELGADVTVAGRTAAIVRRAGTMQRPIVRLAGIDDRDAAESLRGQALTVASAAAPRLPEGEWWAHELEGCLVVDGERRIGTVAQLIELPSCEALAVRPEPAGGIGEEVAGGAGQGVAGATGRGSRGKAGERSGGQAGGEPLLIPLVTDAIRRVDVSARVIEVDMTFIEE